MPPINGPGKGHATLAELWWRWSRLAALRHSARTRPGLTLAQRILVPACAYSSDRSREATFGDTQYEKIWRVLLP